MYQVSDAGNAFANCAMTITNRHVGRWLVSSQLIWLVLIVQIHDSIITALLMLLLMLLRWLWLEPFAFQKSLPKRFLSNEKKPLWPRNMNAARILTRTPSRTTPCTPTPTCCTRKSMIKTWFLLVLDAMKQELFSGTSWRLVSGQMVRCCAYEMLKQQRQLFTDNIKICSKIVHI